MYFYYKNDDRLKYLKEFEKYQWHSPDEIRERQFGKFKKLLNHAYETCPFYTELYSAIGLLPGDIKCIEDIKNIPIISKRDLQKNVEHMISTFHNSKEMYNDFSGGSTGVPTEFWIDKNTLSRKFGSVLMFDQWTGWNIGEKVYYLWGADRDKDRARALKEAIVQKYIYRNSNLNAFDLSESKMEIFAKILNKENPKLIIAYTNFAVEFAKFIENKTTYRLKIPAIITSAETLTLDKRILIERVFGCKVFNRYGSREVGLMACNCSRQEGLHVNSENIFLEIERFKTSHDINGMGEVVVTDLNNFAMPFIRYNTGDISAKIDKLCSCGRGMPLIKDVEGRTSDFIKTKAGKLIHGESFSHLFYGLSEIAQFQIIQKDYDSITVKLVSSTQLSDLLKKSIVTKVNEVFGQKINIFVEQVDIIKPTASGKYRFCISDIDSL